MARPRRNIYTLDMYLKKNMRGEIDNNADVQRNFAWNKEQINELIVTVLTDDYIPDIILGEEENSKLHIVDGGCRTVALIMFKTGMHKITSSIENSLIPYKKKTIGEDGIIYEDAVFDIKNKTYDKLPEELQEKFNEYQINTVIHEHCTSEDISKYIKRYNNHVSMNTDQRAFTYLDKFATRIRKILNSKFFVECNTYSDKDKNKGVMERIIVETLMCSNHLDNWKSNAKQAFRFLNENANEVEFDKLANNLHRLENIITCDIKDIFNKKDSFLFLTLFDKFTNIGEDDSRFVEFLKEFKHTLRNSERNENGVLFDEIDEGAGTKDKPVIIDKINLLEKIMLNYLHVESFENIQVTDEVKFIADILDVDIEAVNDDIDFYNESLKDLTSRTIRDGSKLLSDKNHPSLLAMTVYSYKEDVDLDEWLTEYARSNNAFYMDQKSNFLHMKKDFEQWLRENKKSA